MLPTYGNEWVRLELCDYSEVGAGDTVVFFHDGVGGYVHHRLQQRDATGRWITAGDNNPGIDRGRVSRDDFVGRTSKLIGRPNGL